MASVPPVEVLDPLPWQWSTVTRIALSELVTGG
jgi:hypothetical protein